MVMKNRFIKILAFTAAALGGVGCDDAEYNNIGPRAFLNESVNSIGVAGSKSDFALSPFSYELTPVLSQKLDEDATFKLVLDEKTLDRYNKEQGANYELMDPAMYEFGEPVTIPAGNLNAGTLSIRLKGREENYKPGTYAIPVRMVCVSGGVALSEVTSAYVPVFEVPKTFVDLPYFVGRTGLGCNAFNQSLPVFTVEVRFQVSNTANRNRDVFTNGNGVLLRFEDPQNDGDFKAHSLVQFQGDGWYMNPDKAFEPNKWQHIALTYDGTQVTLYINGANAGSKAGSIDPAFNAVGWFGGNLDAGGGHGTGDSQWWRGCKIIPHEARIWSTCRTEAQIKNNMNGVYAQSNGLVGYWSFEKSTYSEENGFEDLTGGGHNLVTESEFTWIDGIRLSDSSVEWPK